MTSVKAPSDNIIKICITNFHGSLAIVGMHNVTVLDNIMYIYTVFVLFSVHWLMKTKKLLCFR